MVCRYQYAHCPLATYICKRGCRLRRLRRRSRSRPPHAAARRTHTATAAASVATEKLQTDFQFYEGLDVSVL